MIEALDAADVRRWAAACVQALDAHRELIDQINVFPVADADTGTNLLTTMRAALEALLRAPADERAQVGAAFGVLAHGALTGARGNSGVILSQLLRGMAEAVADLDTFTGQTLHDALACGAEFASTAVSEPVGGTMITVIEAASAATSPDHPLHQVAVAATEAAQQALDRTPEQLEVLAEAGVVDAGGRGVLVVLDALVAVIAEESPALHAAQRVTDERREQPAVAPQAHLLYASREAGSDEYAYEVMYLLEGTGEDEVGTLRDVLDQVGDSVSVAGDGNGLWSVHVHCNDIGAAIEAGVEVGRPRQIRVARFADAKSEVPARFVRDRACVVPVRGEALAELFASEGVAVLRVTGEPDPYELLSVITGTGAAHVTVLPGDAGLIEIADEAAIRAVAAGQDVVVVPCASPVQALAAVAVHDRRRRSSDDVVAMAEAAGATRRGEVVLARHDSITWIGPCSAGDVVGLADGEVVVIEPGPGAPATVVSAACTVLERMLTAGGELVTALLGAGVDGEVGASIEEFMHRVHPETGFVAYPAGHPDVVVHLGVE